MTGREVERAPEKRQLWEKSKISKIKRHSFTYSNPVKLQYIMLNPPQLSCLLAISTEGPCVLSHSSTLSPRLYPCMFTAVHFQHARSNRVHFSPWNDMTVVTR